MLCYKEMYGDDIDGNRGVVVINREVEADDADDIVEALYDGFLEDNTTGTQIIMLHCAVAGEDVEIEVEIDDYIENLIERADADEDIKDDEDLQEWLKELKKDIKNSNLVYEILRGAMNGKKYTYENKAISILKEQIKGDAVKGYIAINKNGFVRVPANKIKEVQNG